MTRLELANKLKMEALRVENKIKTANGKDLAQLHWRYAKIMSRINEIENPAPLVLKRYDD